MFNWIRNKLGPYAVAAVIGSIALIFVLTDFISPRGARGLGSGAGEAGSVNGEAISAAEFSQELARRTESLKQMTGGKLTDEQLKMFRIRESVFNQLVQRKLVIQDCRKAGLLPSDEEVREKIAELPYFQKDGKFDLATYRNVLTNNRLNPGKFEDMIRDDLMMQRWMDIVRSRVQVSEDEVQRDFRIGNEKRNLKYVVLDLEAGRKLVQIPAAEVDAFLKDETSAARAKSRYEQLRSSKYKDRKFEEVRREIGRDLLAGEKVEESRKASDRLADQIVPLLGAGSDAKVQALLKPIEVAVKTSGLITLESQGLPGAGDARDVLRDAFADKSPIDPSVGGRAKKYETGGSVIVAVVVDRKSNND